MAVEVTVKRERTVVESVVVVVEKQEMVGRSRCRWWMVAMEEWREAACPEGREPTHVSRAGSQVGSALRQGANGCVSANVRRPSSRSAAAAAAAAAKALTVGERASGAEWVEEVVVERAACLPVESIEQLDSTI